MAVIFLFIDGVGLGEDTDHNPLFSDRWKGFNAMTGGQALTSSAGAIQEEKHCFKPVNATLDIEGLPQSGTGQATLFSGGNAARAIGKHFGPFPHSGTKHLLQQQSLFHKAQERGKRCTFMNAYPDIFFKKARERQRWTCTTLMTKSADIPLNTEKEIRNGTAVTAGITQKGWRSHLNIDIPPITPEEGADRLIKQSVNYDLLLYEYYLTDKAGHSQEKEQANRVIEKYDRFLYHLIRHRPDDCTIVLSSDHGNVEDLSTKTHTLNSVPLFAAGPGARAFQTAESIMDITPAILTVL